MKAITCALLLFAFVLSACGGDKPPMVPDPETTTTAGTDAGAD